MADVDSNRLYQELGEIKGQLSQIPELLKVNNEATNKRIDDLSATLRDQNIAIHKRIDEQTNRLDTHNENIKQLSADMAATKRTAAITGGGAGLSIAAAVQIIKGLIS